MGWRADFIAAKLLCRKKKAIQMVVMENGEITLPGMFSELLGVRPGEPVDATVEDRCVVLKQEVRPPLVGRIIQDPITGLPVIDFGPDAPVLTNEMVAEMLADFP